MHSKTSWVIQTQSLLSRLSALISERSPASAEPQRLTVRAGKGNKKNNNTPCFELVVCSPEFTATERGRRLRSHHHGTHHTPKSKFSRTWSAVMTSCRRRRDWRPKRGSRRPASLGLTHISLEGLRGEFVLIISWHKKRGLFMSCRPRWRSGLCPTVETRSHFSQSAASLAQERLLHATSIVITAAD